MLLSDPARKRFAFVIPVFNHQAMVGKVIEGVLHYGFPVYVVDDGSTDQTPERLKEYSDIIVITHPQNRGKGAALKTGFKAASKTADWAISIDADGQHDPKDAAKLIDELNSDTRAIVVGAREGMEDENVPWTSRSGRLFSNFWVLASGGPWLKDTQSGFRIYPLPEITRLKTRGQRYQFEVEILAIATWHKIPILEVPISVQYASGKLRISHFKPFIDFMRNSVIFTRLITQRLLIPAPLRRKWSTYS